MSKRTLEAIQAECRKKLKKVYGICGAIWGGLFVLLMVFFIIPFFTKGLGRDTSIFGSVFTVIFLTLFIGVFVMVGGGIAVFLSTLDLRKEYKLAYKKAFIDPVLKKMFSNYEHSVNKGIPFQTIYETGMVSLGERFTSNDYIKGEYHGLGFQQADVRVTEEREDSDGNKHQVTVFLGRYIIFEFKKKFEHKTEIVGRRFSNYTVPVVKDFSGKKMRRMPQIELESPDFNKKYKVFAENGSEAFYILDPAFIERIDRLYDAHDGQVLLGFSGNKASRRLSGNGPHLA